MSGRVDVAFEDVRVGLLLVLGCVTVVLGLWQGLHVAPVEVELKMSQKIFYFHAPLGMWSISGTIAAAVAGAAYLWRRSARLDALSASAMEISVVTCAVVLITGSLWARPAWDDWFPWGEPRVTSMLVLFLLGVAYLVTRSSVDEPERRARYSAIVAIVAALDAGLAYAAIHIWNTTHPRIITPQGIGLQADMKSAFFTCIVATGLLFWALVEARFRLAVAEHRAEQLAGELAEGGGQEV
jgi:heme exporter protein C